MEEHAGILDKFDENDKYLNNEDEECDRPSLIVPQHLRSDLEYSHRNYTYTETYHDSINKKKQVAMMEKKFNKYLFKFPKSKNEVLMLLGNLAIFISCIILLFIVFMNRTKGI